MDTVRTKIKRTIFSKDGFVIFSTEDDYSVKGFLDGTEVDRPDDLIGVDVEFMGDWDKDGPHGRTFKFSTLAIKENRIYYFLTKTIKGVPKEAAHAIIKKFGAKVWDVIEKDPKSLLSFRGIGQKSVDKIVTTWAEKKVLYEISTLLGPLGVSGLRIKTIYEHFGENSAALIKQNPYVLVQVHGIGFKFADDLARKLGVSLNSSDRMKACAEYTLLEKMNNEGNSAVSSKDVVSGMQKVLADEESKSVSLDICLVGFKSLLAEDKIDFITGEFTQDIDTRIARNDFVSTKALIQKERMLLAAVKMHAVSRGEVHPDIEGWLAAYEKKTGKTLGDQQRDAVRLANTIPGIFSISGYAGTGKTTVSKAVLELIGLQFAKNEIACCALAGIAATRIKMQSGFSSSTIHSLLGYSHKDKSFKFNSKNKLPQNLILLDEGSMVDTDMMHALFSAIDFNRSTLIILGDPAQLSPVGAGQPYADFLKLEIIPNVTLTKIYRQAAPTESENKVIASFAADVRNGIEPIVTGKHKDFEFHDFTINKAAITQDTPKEVADLVRDENNDLIRNRIGELAATHKSVLSEMMRTKKYWDYITRFQVASPMHKGALGVSSLNEYLQQIFNSNPVAALKVRDRTYGVGDKVVHLKNTNMDVVPLKLYAQYQSSGNSEELKDTERVFNGQLGIVFDARVDEIDVLYPIEQFVATYSSKDIRDGMLDLSYALTVHKTQGSEFHSVVLPMTTSFYSMLNPQLMYTGMTRAKEKLDIVGQKNAFRIACKSKDAHKRVTCINLWVANERKSLEVDSVSIEPDVSRDQEDVIDTSASAPRRRIVF